MVLSKADTNYKKVMSKDEMLKWMKDHELNKEFGEVIVMAGAGDIDALVQTVKEIIEKK